MNTGIGHIYLAWREGRGKPRAVIGVIRRNATDGVRFSYISEGLEEAKSRGFVCYPDFPDEGRTYGGDVLDVFGQRLNKPERGDIGRYYSYWEIDERFKDDKYYLLAHTQGLVQTDNTEFLADYSPIKGQSFISELCGLSELQLESNVLNEGDALSWEAEPDNRYDRYAVKVFKGSTFIGYVKRIHSMFFYKKSPFRRNISITVKDTNKNGHLNRAFIRISI